MLKNVFISLIAISVVCCSAKKQNADLIVHNATIYTVDSVFNTCSAMAIRNGRILELGDENTILNKYEAPTQSNLMGKTVMPGFIDAHCHFLGYGLGLSKVDLVGSKSFAEVVERVVKYSGQELPNKDESGVKLSTESNTNWITGRGWDQNDWDNKTMPDKRMLDSLFPERPVFLTRIDGHAAIANNKALQLAGINAQTKISGGEVLKNGTVLTGVLIDNAVDLVKKHIPQPGINEMVHALLNAQETCLAYGLTTVDDAGLMKQHIDIIDKIQKNGQLKIRVYAMLSDSAPNYEHYLQNGPYKTERLNVRAFKFYADGALGSRGACLLKDYSDRKSWRGFLLSEQKHFEEKAKLLVSGGFQMATHCIGDSAYKLILGAYKKAGASKKLRWRIEHAQVVNPMHMKESDAIIPSVQPTHATSDMYWAHERLGEDRSKHAFAYKDLLSVAGLLALGTDFPVEDVSPFKTFFAAVARQDAKGFPEKGYQMENALSREETLRGMTIWAAYSNFEENEKGSLEPGKYADFVVLDTDLLKCDLKDVLKTKVFATYINGERVYLRRND